MSIAVPTIDILSSLRPVLRAHVKGIAEFVAEGVCEKGANGYLVFGHNDISGQKIAVKYYQWDGGAEFHVEPRKLAEIEHRNVLKLDYAGYVDTEWAYFITPLFQNGDLDDYIARGEVDLKKSLKFVSGVASALSELHSKSLLHRDLKPANILLANNDEAVIADFGSVQQIPEGADGVPAMGGQTLPYRPPESFGGLYGKPGDIYQCGVVLYQLLGGRLPVDEIDWLSPKQRAKYRVLPSRADQSIYVDDVVREKIATGKVLDLNSLPVWIPKSTRAIIREATAVDVTKRYRTASELAMALNDHWNKLPAWQDQGGVIIIDCGDKRFRLSQPKTGFYICEKSVGDQNVWRKHNAVPPGNLRDVCASIQRFL